MSAVEDARARIARAQCDLRDAKNLIAEETRKRAKREQDYLQQKRVSDNWLRILEEAKRRHESELAGANADLDVAERHARERGGGMVGPGGVRQEPQGRYRWPREFRRA